MTLSDWEQIPLGTGILSTANKYAGNSSLQIVKLGNSSFLKRKNFVCKGAVLDIWIYGLLNNTNCHFSAKIDNYGTLDMYSFNTQYTWENFRFTFWYDAPNNTKWGRREKKIGDVWTALAPDTNFGIGNPGAANAIYYGGGGGSVSGHWADEMNVFVL